MIKDDTTLNVNYNPLAFVVWSAYNVKFCVQNYRIPGPLL